MLYDGEKEENSNELTPKGSENLIKNITLYKESDNEIKIQQKGRPHKIINLHARLGKRQKRLLMDVLDDPYHFFCVRSSIKRKQYDRERNLLKQVNRKLVDLFNKEFQINLPNDFKLYELVKSEQAGTYKFKFRIITDSEPFETRFEQMSEEKLLSEINKLGKTYHKSTNHDEKREIQGKHTDALIIAEKKSYLTKDEIESRFLSDVADLVREEIQDKESLHRLNPLSKADI